MEAEAMRKNAEARLDVAQNKCKSLAIECDAESTQHENMAPSRKHLQKIKLNASLQNVATNG